MHDGSMDTLEEVIRFYERGGRKIESGKYAGDGQISPLKNGLVAGFQISDAQRQDLINFLTSLTNKDFITNPRFSDPFAVSASAGAQSQTRALPTPGVYLAPAAATPILSKGEYTARMNGILRDLDQLGVALQKDDVTAARLLAQPLHDRLHELHASSWALDMGPAHNDAEGYLHARLIGPLSTDSAYPPAIIEFIVELRGKLTAMLAQVK